jgi:hypothetical protein
MAARSQGNPVHRGICARRVPVELAFLYATLELRPTGLSEQQLQ